MKELQAHLRGEIKLSETVYHIPPETDVRALRETLGLSQSDFAALFGFNVRSLAGLGTRPPSAGDPHPRVPGRNPA